VAENMLFYIFTQGESGMATTYISRNKALKKLQLSLADFRYVLNIQLRVYIYTCTCTCDIIIIVSSLNGA